MHCFYSYLCKHGQWGDFAGTERCTISHSLRGSYAGISGTQYDPGNCGISSIERTKYWNYGGT